MCEKDTIVPKCFNPAIDIITGTLQIVPGGEGRYFPKRAVAFCEQNAPEGAIGLCGVRWVKGNQFKGFCPIYQTVIKIYAEADTMQSLQESIAKKGVNELSFS